MPTPAEVLATDAETLRGIGLSYAKASYLHDLAERLVDGPPRPDRLRALDDDGARDALTEVRGVGRFTADGCPHARASQARRLAGGDLALRRAVERETGDSILRRRFEQVDALGGSASARGERRSRPRISTRSVEPCEANCGESRDVSA